MKNCGVRIGAVRKKNTCLANPIFSYSCKTLFSIKEVKAAIRQTELNLALRGHHKVKDDGGTQPPTTPGKPAATPHRPPGAPETPNRTPTNEQHHLDPNEHPFADERCRLQK
ncbi:MAG: hypothetical protein LBD21_07665 [Tannerellaceae bacterium]|nr:hypothetical protein [Tannerellaceae bacterium]